MAYASYSQPGGDHPHAKVEDYDGEYDADAEAYSPDYVQIAFTCSRQDDQEDRHSERSPDLESIIIRWRELTELW